MSTLPIMSFEQIEKQIKALDYNWFCAKKKFFALEPSYNVTTKMIDVKFEDVDILWEDDEEGNTHVEYISHQLDLLEYCWNSDFKDNLSRNNEAFDEDGPCNKYDLPTDVKVIFGELCQELEILLKVETPISTKQVAINNILERINNAFERADNDDPEYQQTKQKLSRRATNFVTHRFKSTFDLYNIVTNVLPPKRPLTPALCDEICNVAIGKTTLQLSFRPSSGSKITAGQFLFKLLQPNLEKGISGLGKFYVYETASTCYRFLAVLKKELGIELNRFETTGCLLIRETPFKVNNYDKDFSSKHIDKDSVTFPSLEQLFM